MSELKQALAADAEARIGKMVDEMLEQAQVVVGESGMTAGELLKLCASSRTDTLRGQLVRKLVGVHEVKLLKSL